MFFYLFPLIPLLLIKNKNKVFLFLFFVFLVFFAGFRDISVGTDTLNYYLMFQDIAHGRYRSTEPLWFMTNKIIAFLGGDFQTVKITASILTLLPLYLIFRRMKTPFFAIFIYLTFYYYFYSFNIVRQCIGMSWAFYGVFVLEEATGRTKKYGWIWFIFAWGFHITAVVVPVFYYLRNIFFNKKKRIYLTLFCTIVAGIILGNLFIQIATSIFPNYTSLQETNKTLLSAIIDLVVLNMGFVAVYEFLVKKEFTIWFYFFFVFVLLTNLMVMIPYGNRFIFYAGVMLTVFLGSLPFKKDNPKITRSLTLILLILYCYYRYIRLLGNGEIIPYINTMLNLRIGG